MILERTDSKWIEASANDAFYCFWRAELWPQLTDHVVKVDMIEEQEGYQRYGMHVQVEGKRYIMETQRIAVAPRTISFQQPKPPVFMRAHSGVWSFEQTENGTNVKVVHRLNVDDQKAMETLGVNSVEAAREKIMGNLQRNGLAMIDSVSAFLQSNEGKQHMLAQAS
jgi:aromatase